MLTAYSRRPTFAAFSTVDLESIQRARMYHEVCKEEMHGDCAMSVDEAPLNEAPFRGTIRPISEHDLPTEILHHIFSFTVESAFGDSDPLYFALLLSHVSCRWRFIAHSLPRLWENISITYVGRHDAGRIRLAAMALSLSRFASLTIALPRWIPVGRNYLLDTLITTSVQFRRLHISTQGDPSTLIYALSRHLDHLEELTLQGHGQFIPLDVFRDAPRLQKVTLSLKRETHSQDEEPIDLHLPNLHQLHILPDTWLPIDQWHHLLLQSPNLTHASFSLSPRRLPSLPRSHYGFISANGVPHDGDRDRVPLSQLTSLSLHYPSDLDFRPWTSDISFPELRELNLHAQFGANPHLLHPHQLSSIQVVPWWTNVNVCPNIHQLQRLSLQNVYAPCHVWEEVFGRLSALEELSIGLVMNDFGSSGLSGIGVSGIFDALSRSSRNDSTGEGRPPVLLPSLKRLVGYTRDYALLYPSFQRMIKARAVVAMHGCEDISVANSGSLEVVLGLVDVSGKRVKMYQCVFEEVVRSLRVSASQGRSLTSCLTSMVVRVECLSSSSARFVKKDGDVPSLGGSQKWMEKSVFWAGSACR